MKGLYYKIDVRYLYIMTKSILENDRATKDNKDLVKIAEYYLSRSISQINTDSSKRFFMDCYDAKKIGLAFFESKFLSNYKTIKKIVENSFLAIAVPEFKTMSKKEVESLAFKEKRNLNWFLRNSKYIIGGQE